MRDLDEEPALLAALDALFRDFDGIVTYNGTGFDLPLLETRFVLARRRWPDERLHLDLLSAARRLWSTRLCDCRLGTLEQHVLRFAREDDLPGFMIPGAYFDYLRRKRPGELPRVFEHNRHDVLSLAALTGWVAAAVAGAPRARAIRRNSLGWAGSGKRSTSTAASRATGRRSITGSRVPCRERVLLRLARREKRLARWEEACALWEAATRTMRVSIRSRGRRSPSSTSIGDGTLPPRAPSVEEALSKARVHLAARARRSRSFEASTRAPGPARATGREVRLGSAADRSAGSEPAPRRHRFAVDRPRG